MWMTEQPWKLNMQNKLDSVVHNGRGCAQPWKLNLQNDKEEPSTNMNPEKISHYMVESMHGSYRAEML